ncbi:LysM peptidoglycan-binding domain-containing protein [Rivibacter subsaxonicus]|nr:LysM peptidoglycan-binding domain-containing protein [Rivibacter subsaxonicus]
MTATALTLGLAALTTSVGAAAAEPGFPITAQQRSTAQQVAQAGVPLSELAADAPDSYTVKSGDTLWAISSLYLRSPWKWPELWGMNLEQIRNPHLIFPGQLLVLEKSGGRATLKVAGGQPGGTDRLSPQVRDKGPGGAALAAVAIKYLEGFFNDAVILDSNTLESAPRIVATQEGRVLLGKGDTAYVRGELGGVRDWRVFRRPKALIDPDTKQVLGYEARSVGTAQYVRPGGTNDRGEIVPASFTITNAHEEANLFDRLAPTQSMDEAALVPHAPAQPIDGRVISVYGDALNAGQNQIVAINRGTRDGVERGHVLALWRAGAAARDVTQGGRPQAMRLPDERHGLLFVFRTFDSMSYALILRVERQVTAGDRFTQP